MEVCGICKRNSSTKVCTSCRHYICSECMPSHLELQYCMIGKQNSTADYLCGSHTKPISGYCNVCCKVVCTYCKIQADHSIISPSQTAANIKNDVHCMKGVMNEKLTELAYDKKVYKEKEKELMVIHEKIKNQDKTRMHTSPWLGECKVASIEEQIEELKKSYQRKHMLIKTAESNLESVYKETYSLRILSSWIKFKSAIEDYDKIAQCRQLGKAAAFHSDLENKAYLDRKLVNPGHEEQFPPPNQQVTVDDLASQLMTVTINDGTEHPDEPRTSEASLSTTQDLIGVLYTYASNAKEAECQKSKGVLFEIKVAPEMEVVKQQTEYILKYMHEKTNECFDKEKDLETLNHKYASWTIDIDSKEAEIRTQFELDMKTKDKRIETYTKEIEIMELKLLKQEGEYSSKHKEMEKLKTVTFNQMKKAQEQNQIEFKALEIRNTELQFSLAEEKEKVAKLQGERLTLHNHIIMKDKEIQRVTKENVDKNLSIAKEKETVILLQHEKASLHNHIIMKDKQIQRGMREKEDKILSSFQKQLEQQKEKEKQLKLILKEKDDKISALKKEKDDKIQSLRNEKDDLQTRLSSIAGEKLTAGNPAITDLGDPNRPMKIGEMYGELYDNEWTDAMDVTVEVKEYYPGMDSSEIEEIVIRHLYRILMCTFHQCVSFSTEQLNIIRKSISTTLHLDINYNDESASFPVCKEIIQIRRQSTEKSVNFLLENQVLQEKMVLHDWEYEYKNEHLVLSLMKTPFFEKCIRLCWLMAIQDPNMHLEEDLQPGSKFDKNIYKEFVRSGDKVRYVVWPAMFLHIDGPLLYKGVVQAYWQQ